MLTGAETLEQAISLKAQITRLLNKRGFNLRKWASNKTSLVETPDEQQQKHWCFEFLETHKTLGIFWNPQQDCFLYRFIAPERSKKVTKRSILSQVALYYDPLGLLGPVIVKAKILIQSLWKLQLDWGEIVPMDIHTNWKTFQDSMPELNNISFPRHICMTQTMDLQLHGFADASEAAYGACLRKILK